MPILRQGQEAEFTMPAAGYVSIDATGGAVAEIALPLGAPGGPLRRVTDAAETFSGIRAGAVITVSCVLGSVGYGRDSAAPSPGAGGAMSTTGIIAALQTPDAPGDVAVIQSLVSGASLPPIPTSAVAGGDSFTFGSNATSTANSYIGRLGAAWGTAINNFAIGGTVLQNSNDAGGAPRANNGRDIFAANMLGGAKKDAAIVAWGFNDARYTGAPATFNVANYAADLDQILSALRIGGYADNKIRVVTPHYITDIGLRTGSAGFTGQTRSGFEQYVSAAMTAAYEHGVLLADTYSAMRDGGGASLIDTDLIHPTDTGHALIYGVVRDARKVNGNASSGPPLPKQHVPYGIQATMLPPVGQVSGYHGEIGQATDYSFGTRVTPSTPTLTWTGLAAGTYYVRSRAVFVDGTFSPWIFGNPVTVDNLIGLDTFSGEADNTPLTSHISERGQTWEVQPGYFPSVTPRITAAGTLYATDLQSGYRMGAAPQADYWVEAVLECKTVLASENTAIFGRGQGANTLYFARYSGTSGWQLLKFVANVSTVLGTFAGTFAAGTTKTIRLTMIGTTISVQVDGATVITVTDASITTAGYYGIRMSTAASATTGVHITSITAGV